MTKQDRITELVNELNELQLPEMAATLDSLFRSKDFDSLDKLGFIEKLLDDYSGRSAHALKRVQRIGVAI